MALTILLSGFGPFPGAPSNPTGALVQRLARLRRPALADVRLVPHVFQTSYEAVDRELPQLLSQLRPDAVLMFGLATRASSLQVETRARNAVSALVLDAEGRQAASLCIVPGGPDALRYGVPAARLTIAARRVGAQAVVSHNAGRYLCNYLSWRAIEAAARPAGPSFAAFIHVPKLRQGAVRGGARGARRWRMRDLLRGGEAILLAAAAETRRRRHLKER
ncbi:MAG TPA: pyroglutamyl-peptidase I [Xanthobacteraceae bacterium]|nr:pyroglutamyl-peptidase I [Xanthobacteraceae bacterium]